MCVTFDRRSSSVRSQRIVSPPPLGSCDEKGGAAGCNLSVWVSLLRIKLMGASLLFRQMLSTFALWSEVDSRTCLL